LTSCDTAGEHLVRAAEGRPHVVGVAAELVDRHEAQGRGRHEVVDGVDEQLLQFLCGEVVARHVVELVGAGHRLAQFHTHRWLVAEGHVGLERDVPQPWGG
jgi:hypothetical protein